MNTAPLPQPAYRWVIVFASAAMLAVAMGIMVNGMSIFLIPLQQEFNWARGSVALINFAGLVGLALGGVAVGPIADRIDTRWVCLFGSVVLGLCMLASSRANMLWQFYSLFFVAGFLGVGAIFAPVVANVGNWFKTGAGLAVGIASAGQALGQGGVPFASALLIGAYGWRGAFVALGVVSLSLLVPLSLLIRKSPAAKSAQGESYTKADTVSPVALSTTAVTIWLGVAVFFCCVLMAVPLMHLVSLIQDRGFSAQQASAVAFAMMISAIVGRIAFGRLADMIGAIPAYFTASLWQTLLVMGFLHVSTLNGLYIYAVIYGFGYAGVMTGVLICARTLTPLAKRTTSLGFILVFSWFGHGVGGFQGGYFFDRTGDYGQSYANAAVFGVINLIIVASLFMTLRRRTRQPQMA
jgi:MFS family permease